MYYKTYVINLDRSPDRLSSIAAELQREGIPFERIAAVDGSKLPTAQPDYTSQIDADHFERDLTLGEIGCAMSHFRVLRSFLNSGADYALVLEDDVVLAPGVRNTIHSFIEWVGKSGTGFRAANFGHRAKRPFSPLLQVSSHTFGRSHYYPMTTAALLWTQQGAEHFLRTNPKIAAPIDIQFRRWIGWSGQGWGVRPPLALQSAFVSEIAERKSGKIRRSFTYRYKSYRRKFREKADALFSFVIHGPIVAGANLASMAVKTRQDPD